MDSAQDSDQFTKLQPAFDALPAILKAEKSRQVLTNQQLSDLSGVPLATTGRILAGAVSNPGFFHVAAIVILSFLLLHIIVSRQIKKSKENTP